MIVFGVLFFIFGFVTWLNGSLIPFLKIVCNRPPKRENRRVFRAR